MTTSWTAGVVKHGNDPVTPSPGRVARVTLTHYCLDGSSDATTRDWNGYTAADALAEKRAVFKGNRSRHDLTDGVLTRYGINGCHETYTAEDIA